MRIFPAVFMAVLIGPALSISLWGQLEIAELIATDAERFDSFGAAVSVKGDVAVVGARGHDDNCPGGLSCNTGAA